MKTNFRPQPYLTLLTVLGLEALLLTQNLAGIEWAILTDAHRRMALPHPEAATFAPGQPGEEAYFKFDYPPNPETFIFKLTDPKKIQEARDMLNGQQPGRHIMGTIVKEPAAYNAPWSYHLDPESIKYFDFASEVCDATIQYVEAHLEEACGAFLPGCVWCPWGSRLLEEVTPSATFTPTPTASHPPTLTATLQQTATATPPTTSSATTSPFPSGTPTDTPSPTPTLPIRQYLPLIRK